MRFAFTGLASTPCITSFILAASFLSTVAISPWQSLIAGMAATFGQQEVSSGNFIILAIPRSTDAHSLLILEQLSKQRPCWRVRNDAYQTVEPLLLKFNFKDICGRSTDSNSFSIRTAGKDLGLEYTLRIIYRDNVAVLVGTPRDRNQPELEIGRTRGILRDYMKIDLNPGWRLTRRTFRGQTLGHLYLTHNQTVATIAKTTPGLKAPSAPLSRESNRAPSPEIVVISPSVAPPAVVTSPTPAPPTMVTVPVVKNTAEFQAPAVEESPSSQPTAPPVRTSPAPTAVPFPQPTRLATGPQIPETRPIANSSGLYAPRVLVTPSSSNSALSKPTTLGQPTAREQVSRDINQIYREVLGRDADAAGLSYYLTQVERGRTLADIRRNMEISPEAQQRRQTQANLPQAKPTSEVNVPPSATMTPTNLPPEEVRSIAPNRDAYFTIVPTSPENLPRLAQRIQSLGATPQRILQRATPRGPHVAIGPFLDRGLAEQWSNYLRKNGLDARVYFGQ